MSDSLAENYSKLNKKYQKLKERARELPKQIIDDVKKHVHVFNGIFCNTEETSKFKKILDKIQKKFEENK